VIREVGGVPPPLSYKVFSVNFDLFFSVINLNNLYNKNFILKHTILYIHCVDILMWSPIKLDFPFFKDSDEINKKENDKTAVTVAKSLLL
jgi:hypothetical protein